MPFHFGPDVLPSGLKGVWFHLRPIALADVDLDYAAVMASRDYLVHWEQSGWPAEDFTVEENLRDLQGLVDRHSRGQSFCYTVTNPAETECLGCVYIFPLDAPHLATATVEAVGALQWSEFDAAAYFWLRPSCLDRESEFSRMLRAWFDSAWPIDQVLFVTSEPFIHQVQTLEASGLEVQFRVFEKDKAQPFLAFG